MAFSLKYSLYHSGRNQLQGLWGMPVPNTNLMQPSYLTRGERKKNSEILVTHTVQRHKLPKDGDLIDQDHRRLPLPRAPHRISEHPLTAAFLSRKLTFICLRVCFWLLWLFVAACGLSPVVASGACSLVGRGLSLQWLPWVQSLGSRAPAQRLWQVGYSCSEASGIFPDQGPNPRPLCWQAGAFPLLQQGSPGILLI